MELSDRRGPKRTTNPPNSSSPVKSSEDIVRDGLLDWNRLNFILRNPELPKSRLQMNSIVRQYNEEKRKAMDLSRIQFTMNQNHRNTSIGGNIDDNNVVTNVSTQESIDLDQMTNFEVTFSQLPQELLFNILGETFAKYEDQISQRNDICFEDSVLQTNSVLLKEEVMSDNEENCQPFDKTSEKSESIDELKERLQKLIKEYESIESEENIVLNDLEIISKELENKLSALRECIEICETLKQQNICINQKQNDIKTKKSKLKNEIKEINEKLIELKEDRNEINISSVNNCNVSESVALNPEENQFNIDLSQNFSNSINIAENTHKIKTNPKNAKKVKQKENNVSISDINVKKRKKNFDYISNNCQNLPNDQNDEIIVNSIPSIGTNVQQIEKNDIIVIDESEESDCEIVKCSVNWKENYVLKGFNPNHYKKNSSLVLPSNSKSSSTLSRSSHTVSSPKTIISQDRDLLKNSESSVQNSGSAASSDKNQSNTVEPIIVSNPDCSSHLIKPNSNNDISNRESNERHQRKQTTSYELNRDNRNVVQNSSNENLCEVGHWVSLPNTHVCCLFATDKHLFVGLRYGFINRYTFNSNGLHFDHKYPNLSTDISALYFNQRYNYLFCGTVVGLFAFLNNKSNDLNYNKIELTNKFRIKRPSIDCFENSATILFIGLSDGFIYRFGLMSNQMVNEFKALDEPIIGLKLVNDLSERIIVSGEHEISIRNSVNGSLLNTLERTDNRSPFIFTHILSNKIIICSNYRNEYIHRFYFYDENTRDIINHFHYKSLVRFGAINGNHLYILTIENDLYCFDLETLSIQWKTNLKLNNKPICLTANSDRIIVGLTYAKVVQIIPNQFPPPSICNIYRCKQKFVRHSDIFDHLYNQHALPFYQMNKYKKFPFNCPWIGCDLRIKNSSNLLQMIVEHMKTHII